VSPDNSWTRNAAALADAYVREAGTVGFQIVTRWLLSHLPEPPQRIVDVGGGYGRQAIMLAEAGHSVVVVDIDPKMLAIAREFLGQEADIVRSRVRLILGDAAKATVLAGTDFDLACCHNVLMYEDDPVPIVRELVRLVRPGGLISIVSLNMDAYAMRSGLQGRWEEAASLLLDDGTTRSRTGVLSRHSRAEIGRLLEEVGATVKNWHGLGVFTDHRTEPIVVDDPARVFLVEWLAGHRDPYRQVARCFHLLAEKASG
jgi:S-adenosylmethionine-dependent methyltransferase